VIFVSSVLVVAVLPPGARAQAEAPSGTTSGYVITSDVNGNSVTTRDAPNRNIGTVRGFVLAEPDGQALYMIVDVGGFLGIGAAEIVIPFSLVTFTGQGGRPLVAVPSDMIGAAPRVTDADIEQLLANQNWRRSVADFYGVQADPPPLASPAAAHSGPSAATAAPPSAAQGWYTSAQAAGGATDFAQHCASCHGAALQGGAGPALVGAGFLASWSSRTVADLDNFEHEQMPLTTPGSLTDEQYTRITAFILEKNGFPPGARPLDPAERALLHPTAANRDLQQRLTANAPQAGSPGPAAAQPSPAIPAKQPSTAGPTETEILAADTATTYWPFFNKGLMGYRYSTLDLIDTGNAASLRAVCAYQLGEVGSFQTGPVMYDGLVYVTTTHGTYALDATTCRAVWNHQYVPKGPEVTNNNKGAAIAQGRVIRGTQDGHLFALDAKTGVVLWDVAAMDPTKGEFITAAPIVWNDLIFVGKAGGDWGIMGEMMAFRAGDGSKVWGRPLIPSGSEPGADTWKERATAKTGGGSTWTSYALDAAAGTLFVPVGNPGPDFNNSVRPGANLYTNSVVALDANTGEVRWWYQLVPNDFHDWDTSTVMIFDGQDGSKLVAAAGKDGVLHVLDRANGSLVFKVPVTTLFNGEAPITPAGTRYCPGTVGGVEWNGAAYSPSTDQLYINAVDWCVTSVLGPAPQYVPGQIYTGLKNGFGTFDPIDKASGWTNAVKADGSMTWRYHSPTPMTAAVTPTAGGVVFTGDLNGEFLALDARSGEVLYRFNTGGAIGGGIITYEVDGKQYVTVASGNASRTTWYTAGSATVFIFGQ
jgi:PQQ-dependent dehydrogenase (methanol/ethanol family)